MKNRIATIARYTLLEAARARLLLFTVMVVLVLVAASLFIRGIAITESTRFQIGFYAACARYATVIVAALYLIASVSREFQDKGLDVALALDLPRSHYILGKLVAFLFLGTALAVAASVPLAVVDGWERATLWGTSLAFELALVVSLALFCVITLNHVMPAFVFVLAFYVLARTLTVIRLISANPIADATAPAHRFMRGLVESLALVVPPVDAWTRTTWLVDERAPWSVLIAIAESSVLFVVIVTAAAIFDIQRRNF